MLDSNPVSPLIIDLMHLYYWLQTNHELRKLCCIRIGSNHVSLPDPEVDWREFVFAVQELSDTSIKVQ